MPNRDPSLSKSRLEALLAMGSGAVAEPLAGLAGLYGVATGGTGKGVRLIDKVRDKLTYQPTDTRGQQELARALGPLARLLESGRSGLGDAAFGATGSPAAAAAAYTAPDALLSLLGYRPAVVGAERAAAGVGAAARRADQLATTGQRMHPQAGMIAYHGTPHQFDHFDMSKVGTGEGAQAYGHGLYFADSPGVARQYQQQLSQTAKVSDAAKDAFQKAYPSGEAVIGKIHYPRPDGLSRAYKDGYVSRAELDPRVADAFDAEPGSGSLYHVDLPDEQVAKFLDWDAPLTPEIVRAVQEASPGYMSGGMPNKGVSQSDAYLHLAEKLGSDAAASQFLRERGIPGIRYLDGNSRGAGAGTSNYVVFDDQLPRIVGRE